MRIIFKALLALSIIFIILRALAPILQDPSSIPGNMVIPLVILIAISAICYKLEGVQQAANSVKSIDADVVEGECSTKAYALSIEKLKDKYEEFSSARQIASIGAILLFKSALSSIPIKENTLLESALTYPLFEFTASAFFIAWILQLYPKRQARKDPVHFLSGWNIKFANMLTKFGSLGVSSPLYTLESVVSFVTQNPVKGDKTYALSAEKLINEFGIRSGYYAENATLWIIFGKRNRLLSNCTFRFTPSPHEDRAYLNKLIHRISLSGSWIPGDITGSNTMNIETSTDIRFARSEELVTAVIRSDEPIDDEDEIICCDREPDHDEAEDEYNISINKNYRQTSRFTSEVHFAGSVDRNSLIDETLSVSVEFFQLDNNGSDPVHKISVRLANPSKNVKVVVCSSLEERKPTGSEVIVKDMFGEEESKRPDFISSKDCTFSDEKAFHKYEIDLKLPSPGCSLDIISRY